MTHGPIRPELPGIQRALIDVGQVWSVEGEDHVRWFVLTPRRIVALFAGADDHTPESLVFTYGDRLRLEGTATVYAANERNGRHEFVLGGGRDEHYIALCRLCGEPPLEAVHRYTTGRLIP